MESILREWLFKLGLTHVAAMACCLTVLTISSSLKPLDFWWLPVWLFVMMFLIIKTLLDSTHWNQNELKEHAFERFIWHLFYGSLFVLVSSFILTTVLIGEDIFLRFFIYPLQAAGMIYLIWSWFERRKQATQYYSQLLKEFSLA